MTEPANVALHVRQLGDEGPPVVLLHGLFGSGDNLAGLGAELARSHRVLLADLRNHGRSGWSDELTLAAMAADVVAVLDGLDIRKAALVGHSLGGKVAMQVALQFPERVTAVVVADIAPVRYAPSHQPVFAGLAAVDLERVGRRGDADRMLSRHVAEPMVRGFLLKSLAPAAAEEPTATGATGKRFHWRFNWRALQEHYADLSAAPEGDPFHGPVLIVRGGASDYVQPDRTVQPGKPVQSDKPVQPDHESAIRERFPNAEIKTIAGAGHWLHAEKPAEFNSLVCQWLGGR